MLNGVWNTRDRVPRAPWRSALPAARSALLAQSCCLGSLARPRTRMCMAIAGWGPVGPGTLLWGFCPSLTVTLSSVWMSPCLLVRSEPWQHLSRVVNNHLMGSPACVKLPREFVVLVANCGLESYTEAVQGRCNNKYC